MLRTPVFALGAARRAHWTTFQSMKDVWTRCRVVQGAGRPALATDRPSGAVVNPCWMRWLDVPGWLVEGVYRLPCPRGDCPACWPLDGPYETRSPRGAGRPRRATGCSAAVSSQERRSVSVPRGLPARRVIPQLQEFVHEQLLCRAGLGQPNSRRVRDRRARQRARTARCGSRRRRTGRAQTPPRALAPPVRGHRAALRPRRRYAARGRLRVVPIHPNAVKATRPRYRSHGAKSDASDAYLLADLLRTDGHRFKALTPQGDEIRALRALVRGRDDLVATRVQLANQLRSLLESFWPGAAASSPTSTRRSRWPSSNATRRPSRASRSAPSASRLPCPTRLLRPAQRPKNCSLGCTQAPAAVCAELQMEAKGELARCLAANPAQRSSSRSPALQPHRARRRLARDGQILMSFPRAGRICAAQILAELGGVRERFPSDASSPPKPASLPSPTSRASPRPSPSDGPATTACAPPSPAWPTTPATPAPGPRTSTPRPGTRLRPSPRHPHPRPRLVARDLARLDRSHNLRPLPAPRRSTALQNESGLTQDVS